MDSRSEGPTSLPHWTGGGTMWSSEVDHGWRTALCHGGSEGGSETRLPGQESPGRAQGTQTGSRPREERPGRLKPGRQGGSG